MINDIGKRLDEAHAEHEAWRIKYPAAELPTPRTRESDDFIKTEAARLRRQAGDIDARLLEQLDFTNWTPIGDDWQTREAVQRLKEDGYIEVTTSCRLKRKAFYP
jgi:hypothetical protein